MSTAASIPGKVSVLVGSVVHKFRPREINFEFPVAPRYYRNELNTLIWTDCHSKPSTLGVTIWWICFVLTWPSRVTGRSVSSPKTNKPTKNVWLWIMDPHSRAAKKNTSHGNEVLPQDTTHLIQNHVTNEKVCAKIQQASGPHEDLLLQWRDKNWSGIDMSPVH